MATLSRYSFILGFQVLLIILFAVFVRYEKKESHETDSVVEASREGNLGHAEKKEVFTSIGYAMFQDIHVMIFVGFAFLMTFLKRYGYSATGFNLFLASVAVQWALFCTSIPDMEDGKMTLSMGSLMNADIAAATVLIAMGALLGRTTGPQLLVMTILEIPLFAVNEYISIHTFHVADCGGSIAVHIFGAYFGLGVSLILSRSKTVSEAPAGPRAISENLEGPSYSSDITAMIGTLFLWIFWPSFNAGLLTTDVERYRAVTNTYLSLAAATVVAFTTSAWVRRDNKLDMVHIQNSTLAGGVAIGAVSNMAVMPFGALIIGSISGLLSVFGYHKLTPYMDKKLPLKDTCGVHNLHGMPGVLSALVSVIFAAIASASSYYDEKDLFSVFPAMAPGALDASGEAAPGRSGSTQAVFQLAALGVTLAISIVGGIITGLVLRQMPSLKTEKLYNDEENWHLEDRKSVV